MIEHEKYMRLALNVALGNQQAPFGTVLVDVEDPDAIVEGLNRSSEDPVLHGEIDAIQRYAQQGRGRWDRLRLYTTAEPCCMCQAAIIWAGIPEVIFGTSIETLIDLGWNQFDLKASDIVASARFANCAITAGVLAEQCDQLFAAATARKNDSAQ